MLSIRSANSTQHKVISGVKALNASRVEKGYPRKRHFQDSAFLSRLCNFFLLAIGRWHPVLRHSMSSSYSAQAFTSPILSFYPITYGATEFSPTCRLAACTMPAATVDEAADISLLSSCPVLYLFLKSPAENRSCQRSKSYKSLQLIHQSVFSTL